MGDDLSLKHGLRGSTGLTREVVCVLCVCHLTPHSQMSLLPERSGHEFLLRETLSINDSIVFFDSLTLVLETAAAAAA